MKTFFYILALGALLVSQTYGGEFWISPVGTDYTGSGTAASPWIRSSQASFDALFDISNAIPPNSTVHLMAGTFLTQGYLSLTNGLKLRGAGIDVTKIQISNLTTNVPAANEVVVLGYNLWYNRYDGVEVSDMTLDCNLQNQSRPVAIGAIYLQGAETKISRVKAINWGSTTNSTECFIFLINTPFSAATNMTNCLIENCVVEQPAQVTHQNGSDGFCMFADPTNPEDINSPGWICGAEIRNCIIDGIGQDGFGNPTYFKGAGFAAVNGGKVDGNIFINVNGTGYASSCGSLANISIENNMFLDVQTGIGFYSGDYCGDSDTNYFKENIHLNNNIITVPTGGYGMYLSGINGTDITNLDLENNKIQSVDGAGTNASVAIWTANDVTVQNNTLDANGGMALNVYPGVGVSYIGNNLNLAGMPASMAGVPSLNQELQTTFIPTNGGWYRIATGTGNQICGTILVDQGPVLFTNSFTYQTSLEFTFNIPWAANLGNITLLRNLDYGGGGGAVSNIRIVSYPWNGYNIPQFVDIYVGAFNGITPMTVRFRDTSSLYIPLPAPVYEGTGPDPTTNSIAVAMNLAPSSFQTAGSIVSGTNNIQLTSQGGTILNSALSTNIPVTNLYGGVGASSNTFWRGDGTWATPASPMTVKKTADQSSTNTTLTAVTNLSFSVSTNTDYAFEFFVVFQSSATANGIELAVNAPAGATLTYLAMPQVMNNIPNSNNNFQNQTFDVANGTIATSTIDMQNTNRVALVKGSVSIGSTAGTVNLMFGSGISGKTTTIKKGSWGTFF